MIKKNIKKIKRGVRGVSLRTAKVNQLLSFLYSVKPLPWWKEKDCVLGFEPVTKFLPFRQAKIGD